MNQQSISLPDTSFLKVIIDGDKNSVNGFETNEDGELIKHYQNEDGTRYFITSKSKTIHVEHINGKGSQENYIAGYEIKIKNWKDLDRVRKQVKSKVEFIPTESGEMLRVQSILETEADIFVWLGFLDLNVLIIIVLMVLIGIINMGSALLVMILVRTNFIGILKSMGATNWGIRKIFLIQASFLILRGMLIGNLVGLAIAFAQYYFNFIPLNPEVYYLNTVPIELSFGSWLMLNLGTLIICVVALIVPSVVITRISPAKAVRFN